MEGKGCIGKEVGLGEKLCLDRIGLFFDPPKQAKAERGRRRRKVWGCNQEDVRVNQHSDSQRAFALRGD